MVVTDIMMRDRRPIKGLLGVEWVMMAYALLTTLIIFAWFNRFPQPVPMLSGRAGMVLMTLAAWAIYRLLPCKLTMLARVLLQIALLSWWYPDTFELNRVLPNLDHVFASWEQTLFGFQPALTFCQSWNSPVVSELLSLGYVSYYPMIAAVVIYYFFRYYEHFLRTAFIILTSFFIFYLIFIALPVAGPQFYYQAVGVDQIGQGIFPELGNYFATIDFDVHDQSLCLPTPGYEKGLFHRLLVDAHNAGERPTAAFPSSHVGITTVLMWLAWESRSRKLFFSLLPLALLMFFATFYIQAHYAIDAIAGVIAGALIYFVLHLVYDLVKK